MAMLTAACGGTPAAGFSSGASIALPEITPSPHENTPSALRDPSRPGLPRPLVDPAEVLPGGPPPDGIPPIDHPRFERANAVHWIHDREPVISLTVGTDSRAYPIQVLIWHEIVNDTVGGEAVAVTYCPLCNSAIAFKRRDGERMLEFGTSGMLYRSDLVMYDRQTESLWSQFIGTAIEGVLTGHQLSSIPVQLVGWADWRTAHSNGWVLSSTAATSISCVRATASPTWRRAARGTSWGRPQGGRWPARRLPRWRTTIPSGSPGRPFCPRPVW